MSEEPGRKSHVMTWTILIVALPLLYMLGAPWVHIGLVNHGYLTMGEPTPFDWIADHNPFPESMSAYRSWCVEIAIKNHWMIPGHMW